MGTLTGAGAIAWATLRAPSVAEQSEIERLVQAAHAAGSQAMWVYPRKGDPENTSYRWLLKLEALDGAPARHVSRSARSLREEFTETLVALGDLYHDRPGAAPYAVEFYGQALVFDPEHAHARSRVRASRVQLMNLTDAAASGDFSDAELAAVEPLAILAELKDEPHEAVVDALVEYHHATDPQSLTSERILRGMVGETGAQLGDEGALVAQASALTSAKRRDSSSAEPEDEQEVEGPEADADADADARAATPQPTGRAQPQASRTKRRGRSRENEPSAGEKPAAIDPLQGVEEAEELISAGDAQYRSGQYSAAKKSYHWALERDVGNHKAFFGLC
ncbi:MAG: hypothetical protein KC468_12750, partial [Myxococcales bacterium]|nr:hypothetical protein [Myxococcales bacterium]